MTKSFSFQRMGEWAKAFKPFATLIQVIAIIVASLLAIVQLHEGNLQAKISITSTFLNNMQNTDYQTKYFDSIVWLEDSMSDPQKKDNPPSSMDKYLTYVLNQYSNLYILYRKEVLDKNTIEYTVGVDIAQFWLLTTCVLTPEQLRGYEYLDRFYNELEKCDAVRNSKSYKDLKEKLQCKRQSNPHSEK